MGCCVVNEQLRSQHIFCIFVHLRLDLSLKHWVKAWARQIARVFASLSSVVLPLIIFFTNALDFYVSLKTVFQDTKFWMCISEQQDLLQRGENVSAEFQSRGAASTGAQA